jgi:hypothetical protein
LDLKFTFAVRGRNIEAGRLGETLGTRDLTNTAMLILFTAGLHLATLSGAKDVTSVSTMVFCGVCQSSLALQVVVDK